MALKRDELSNPTSCLNKASDDEPVFVLRAHDPLAADTIRYWAGLRRAQRGLEAKTDEALACADSMERWRQGQLDKLFADHGETIIEAGGTAPRRRVKAPAE